MGRLVALGRIAGIFGIKGWVRVHSYTDPRERILDYRPWILRSGGAEMAVELMQGRRHAKTVIALLKGCAEPVDAGRLVGAEIAVERGQLPPATDEAVLWTDLEGLQVVTVAGAELGQVDHLLETGANDVLVVRGERERLIPWLRDEVVREVDLAAGRLVVDWDPEF